MSGQISAVLAQFPVLQAADSVPAGWVLLSPQLWSVPWGQWECPGSAPGNNWECSIPGVSASPSFPGNASKAENAFPDCSRKIVQPKQQNLGALWDPFPQEICCKVPVDGASSWAPFPVPPFAGVSPAKTQTPGQT